MKNTCTCAFWNNENSDYTIHLRSVTFQFLLSSFSLLSLNFWVESGVSRECAESPLTPLALDSNQAPDMIVQTTWSSHPPDLELTLDCQKFYRSGQLIITQGPRLGPLLFSGSDWGLRLLHDCGWWPWGIKFVYSGPSGPRAGQASASDDVMQHRVASTGELGQGGPGLTLTVTAGQAESGAGVGARFQGHCVSGLTRRTRA